MKIFGLDISIKKALQSVPSNRGWYSLIGETTTGGWQRGETLEADTALSHSAVWACVNLIANDIAKLPIGITEQTGAYWATKPHQYDALLKRPNGYQHRAQFIQSWMTSKLLHGNAYVIKQRGAMGRISALHVVDPKRVQPLIADDGSVFYRISSDDKLTVSNVTVPAREIIHDRGLCPWHPLVGVSPLVAASLAASTAMNAQSGAAAFFRNGSAPGGVLSTPGAMTQEEVREAQATWEASHGGGNRGRIAVFGGGIEYKPFSMSAIDSQLLETLQFSSADVARAFNIPAWKIGAGAPAPYTSSEATNLAYLSDCLHQYIEAVELALDSGLELPDHQRTELDESSLLRLDTKTKIDTLAASIKAGLMTINEARAEQGKPPVAGGDELYRQIQDVPLAGSQQP